MGPRTFSGLSWKFPEVKQEVQGRWKFSWATVNRLVYLELSCIYVSLYEHQFELQAYFQPNQSHLETPARN